MSEFHGSLAGTAVLLWGKGSGKDYLCSILVCYLVYVLLCLRDPQKYLRLAPGEPIDLINVAYNADQAKRVFFEKLKQRIKRWEWLRQNYNVIEAGRRVNEQKLGRALVVINDDFIEFPHQIRAWSRHAQNESYEGLNILVWLMDEASAFLSKLKRENASSSPSGSRGVQALQQSSALLRRTMPRCREPRTKPQDAPGPGAQPRAARRQQTAQKRTHKAREGAG